MAKKIAGLIQCVKIEMEGMPFLIGEFAEIEQLVESMVGPLHEVESDISVTLTFPRMTRKELDAIPEWEP